MLSVCLLLEGGFLIAFSQATTVAVAVTFLLVFGLFTHMACGTLYALVPFIDRKALGGVTGIIGAGGNIGGVIAGFLARGLGNVQQSFFILGCGALVLSVLAGLIRFSLAHKEAEQKLYDEAVAQRLATYGDAATGVVATA